MELRSYQAATVTEMVSRLNSGDKKSVCVFAPTGAGKTICFRRITKDASDLGSKVAIYVDRIELRNQTAAALDAEGIDYGLRASGCDDMLDMTKPVQLCMLQTVKSQLKKNKPLPAADIVIVDEAHDATTGQSADILNRHKEGGAMLIGFTATPVEMNGMYESLYTMVTYKECIENGWLLPAVYKYVCEPDRKWIKKEKTGEHLLDDKMIPIYCQQVVGGVIQNYRANNPLGLPTLLFAPDCKSSRWMCEKLNESGIKSAHVDGSECFVDETRYPGTKKRNEIIERFKRNEIKVITNRFVMTTGIDIPEIWQLILAVPFGSLKVFRQAFGRLVRPFKSESGFKYEEVLCQDHGGNFLRHGDPMADVDWALDKTQKSYAKEHEFNVMHKPKEFEPIICAKCGAMRTVVPGADNATCFSCGYQGHPGVRRILEKDGKLRTARTGFFGTMRYPKDNDLEQNWIRTYHAMRKKNKTFKQAFDWFRHLNYNVHPSWEWNCMPRKDFHAVNEIPICIAEKMGMVNFRDKVKS